MQALCARMGGVSLSTRPAALTQRVAVTGKPMIAAPMRTSTTSRGALLVVAGGKNIARYSHIYQLCPAS